jgi:hypothetical protein
MLVDLVNDDDVFAMWDEYDCHTASLPRVQQRWAQLTASGMWVIIWAIHATFMLACS